MKKRIISMLTSIGIFVFALLPVCSSAVSKNSEAGNDVPVCNEITENVARDAMMTGDAVIMQGNTYSASDCVEFENALEASENGYTMIQRYGWYENVSKLNKSSQRVTSVQFQQMKNFKVAYYSGHGASSNPILNHEGDDIVSYGTSDPIDVAQVLGVQSDSSWSANCVLDTSDPLRVLILASCFQLNDNNAKYYVRLMKSSKLRVVAGYYGVAPGTDVDDDIAESFVNYCAEGTSILSSWEQGNNAGGTQPWAVLVYYSNGNQYYRLPGFPGNTYSDPSSSAPIYRYRRGVIEEWTATRTATTNDITDLIETAPLRLAAVETRGTTDVETETREFVWEASVVDNDASIRNYFATEWEESVDNKIVTQYAVTKDEINEDIGVVPGSEVVVERTYQYFDTYNGIKIADSYIRASIDSQGIRNVSINKRPVEQESTELQTMDRGRSAGKNTVSQEAALKALYAQEPGLAVSEFRGTSLAYAPDGQGGYVLCYEFAFEFGFRYVSVVDGEVLYF